MIFLWIFLGILYLACWVVLGMSTLRKGHYVLFWVGFVFPILWIVGGFMGPTPNAAARAGGVAA
jgi:hypothetical protein